jgi:hypothetical protein
MMGCIELETKEIVGYSTSKKQNMLIIIAERFISRVLKNCGYYPAVSTSDGGICIYHNPVDSWSGLVKFIPLLSEKNHYRKDNAICKI